LIVDIGGTAQSVLSIGSPPLLSGSFTAAGSGTVIGQSCNLINSDTYCNINIAGISQSGQLRVQVQTADTDTSGSYTDPTSGLPQFPTSFQSGGILWINSGGVLGGVLAGQTSGYAIASGFNVFAAFIRNGTFVRANVIGEGTSQYAGPLTVSFVSQNKTTGSGGGAWSQSGVPVINV